MPLFNRRLVLKRLAALPACAWTFAAAAPTRPLSLPLMLAREAPADIDPAGWLVSEKYDGVRACWDGRHLVLRSGRPLAPPPGFTRHWPATPLDGELWLGRSRFDALSAAVRRERAHDDEWRTIRYMVFDLPGAAGPFAARAARIEDLVLAAGASSLVAVLQQVLADRAALRRRLDEVVRGGGEGLMLHRADALHVGGRSAALLKLKLVHDAEAVVVGHLPGRGRNAGRLGALHLRTDDGVEFLVGTGLSDADRDAPPAVGSVVTFSYRGLTAAGVPRFAAFLRRREL